MSLFGDELEEPIHTPQDEAEARDVLASPISMSYCLGHSDVEHNLLSLHRDNKLPHALLFCGIKGIGKSTFAHRFAKFLLSQPSDDGMGLFAADPMPAPDTMDIAQDQQDARLYVGGAHPDARYIQRPFDEDKGVYKDAVELSEIRKIEPFLRLSASDGGYRVVVIDDADTMNNNAQNALLKILEEPPAKTILILIAHRPGRLIPTIHSRVSRVNFAPLSDADLSYLLDRAEDPVSSLQKPHIMTLARGSIGTALDLIDNGGLEALQLFADCFETYPRFEIAQHIKLANQLGKAGALAQYRAFTNISLQVLELCTSHKARGLAMPESLLPYEGLVSYYNDTSAQHFMDTADAVRGIFNKVDRSNLDKKQGLLSALHLILGANHA